MMDRSAGRAIWESDEGQHMLRFLYLGNQVPAWDDAPVTMKNYIMRLAEIAVNAMEAK